MTKQTEDRKQKKRERATLWVVIITAFITTFTGSALNLAIPSIGNHFGVSAAVVGWIVTAYMLTVAALTVPFGRLADLTSRKKILCIGILIFSLTSLLSAFAWNMPVMILCRAVQGLGASMVFSTNTAVLISTFPVETRGKVLGYSVASTYIGLSAGPVIGGLLNHYLGWRSIFITTAVIAGAICIVAYKWLPKQKVETEKKGYDIPGNILYVGMIALTMYGLTILKLKPLPLIILAVGIGMIIAFVFWEMKADNPVVQMRLFKNNIGYTFSNLAALMNYAATFAIGYLLSIYLQVVMGYSSQTAGIILIIQPVIMALLSPYAGKLSDRISPFKLSSFGMGLCGMGLLTFVFISEDTSLWFLILGLVVTGLGFAFFSSPNTNAVMDCVEMKDYGVASSILATMRSIGHTGSMVIITFVVGIYMGSTALADAEPKLLVTTMRTAFIIFTAICVVGIFISAKRKRK